MDLVSQILNVFTVYNYSTEAIVASVPHPRYVLDAATLGAEIATVPYAVLKKLFNHSLTDVGIDRFLKDWKGLRNNLALELRDKPAFVPPEDITDEISVMSLGSLVIPLPR